MAWICVAESTRYPRSFKRKSTRAKSSKKKKEDMSEEKKGGARFAEVLEDLGSAGDEKFSKYAKSTHSYCGKTCRNLEEGEQM